MLQTRKERKFERTSDPWKRSRLVGEKISEMMGKDKKTIQELLALVDPPTTR